MVVLSACITSFVVHVHSLVHVYFPKLVFTQTAAFSLSDKLNVQCVSVTGALNVFS